MSEGCTSFSGGDISPGTLRACPQMSAHCRATAKSDLKFQKGSTLQSTFPQ